MKQNKTAFSTWIAERLVKDFNNYSYLTVDGMMIILRDRYGLFVLATKLYRAHCKAKGDTMEKHTIEFVILRLYAHMVLKTNSRSTAKVKSRVLHSLQPPVFERIFFCF